MRELEQLRSKPELSVATLIALVHAHKQHKTPGMDKINFHRLLLHFFFNI